jgi:hypothetical protein
MSGRAKVTALVIAGLLLSTGRLVQIAAAESRTSVGLDLGYFLAAGDWKTHRFASGVDQFKGDFAVQVDLEVRVARWAGISLNAGYFGLDPSEWESFAASQGDQLSCSGRAFHAGLVLKPYILTDDYNTVKLDLGANVFFLEGEETFGNLTYDYDFLSEHRLGYIAGIEYDRMVNDHIAVTLKMAGVFVPSGVEYADGRSHMVTGFPFTVGARFHF